jgi:hypothetical protein
MTENRTLSFFMLDKAWKVGLLDFFNVGKSSRSLTQSFFRPEKTFFCGKAEFNFPSFFHQ